MNRHMTRLKALVQEALTTAPNAALAAPVVKIRLLEISEINVGLFQAIRQEVFSQVSDRLVERHLQQTQHDCILLLQLLEQQWQTGCTMKMAMVLLLEEVLDYLETQHHRYFCVKSQVPERKLNLALSELNEQLKLLSTGFKRKGVELPLQELLLKSFHDFIKSGKASYEKLAYMKHLQTSLINICRDVQAEDFTRIMMEHLLYLRFNSASYEGYYKSRLLENLDRVYSLMEKLELLYQMEKVMKGQQERGMVCFDSYSPSLVVVLTSFIKAEVKYLQKKQGIALLGQPPATKRGVLATQQVPDYRVKVSISADALAYLLRLLIEAGVILACPRSELMVFIARNFQTPGIGNGYLSANCASMEIQNVDLCQRFFTILLLFLCDDIKKFYSIYFHGFACGSVCSG